MQKRAISKNFFEAKELGENFVGDKRVSHKILDFRKIETKIDVYEDRVKTWFLDVARYLTLKNEVKINEEKFDTNEAGFAILQIAVSYIEGNQQYREGKESLNNSREYFIKGMERIFNRKSANSKKHLEEFYKQVRCGLFHDGMTRKKVTINGEFNYRIKVTKNEITINPYKFLDAVYEDLNRYIQLLKNKRNKRLRTNFEKRWFVTG